MNLLHHPQPSLVQGGPIHVLVNHPEEHVEVGCASPFAFKSRFYRTPNSTTRSCLHLIFLHIKDGCKHALPKRLFPKSGFWMPAVVMREHGVRPVPSLIFSPKCLTLLDTFRNPPARYDRKAKLNRTAIIPHHLDRTEELRDHAYIKE